MTPLDERARRVLQHEQRTNHADVAVKPGGLALFFSRWATDARAAQHPHADRLGSMFAEYAMLDPMQRVARVRAALALVASNPQETAIATNPAASTPQHAAHQRENPVVVIAAQAQHAAPQRVTPSLGSIPASVANTRAARELRTASPLVAPQPSAPPKPAKPKAAGPIRTTIPVGEYLLDTAVTVVPSIGPAMASKLERLGIRTVRDLLYHLPREHLDYSSLQKIATLPFDEIVTTIGVIWEVENVRSGNGRMVRTVARISDDSGQIRAVWFNQQYLLKQLPRGAQIVLTGIKQRFGNAVQLTVKSHELPEQGDLVNTGRLVPVYPLTEGLSAKALRRATKWVVDRCTSLVADYLPITIRQSAQLVALPLALADFHYPESGRALDAARHRLAFDEMFIIQLGMLLRRANWQDGPRSPVLAVDRGWILAGGPTPNPSPSADGEGNSTFADRLAGNDVRLQELDTIENKNRAASSNVLIEKGLPGEKRREICRDLRQRQTGAELFFWEMVRDHRLEGYQFRRQHPIGKYVADFFCPALKLVIELDGGVHSQQKEQDRMRDEIMAEHGLQVMRIKNEDFLANPEATLESINIQYMQPHAALEAQKRLAPLSIRRWGGAGGGATLWGDLVATAQCFEESLPFALTDAQQRVICEILDDLARPQPMIRLVQGDVGSGKTVVAVAALLTAALCGYQGAIMAPTEILAEQHARSLTRMLAPFGIEVAVLLGSQRAKARTEALAAIESGRAGVIVGTHALIQDGVHFARLGVAVVDEQHRFGVGQRELLRRKGGELSPHLLVMTATPIPRTLALSVYGDLDLSIIDQMPRGRLPIITRWRAGARSDEAYHQMAQEIAQGRQGYIICSLIEESEALEAKAAVAEYERLRTEVFPHLRMGLVHGALKPAEKDATMRRFRDGEIDILVATAVVEVGVDVPNATVMLIEDADRFGLAQLHQFRGRIGRGEHQSYCYLLSADASATARERLTVIEGTTDGLKLAEEDLRLRGPGEFFGTRQSGLPELQVAELTDAPLVATARHEAEALWQRDPFLKAAEHNALRERVALFWRSVSAQ